MGTWVGVIAETGARFDFWTVARRHHVLPADERVPPHVIIDCGAHFDAPFRLAQTLSLELGTMAMGFVVQTSADVHEVQVFDKGACVRRLA